MTLCRGCLGSGEDTPDRAQVAALTVVSLFELLSSLQPLEEVCLKAEVLVSLCQKASCSYLHEK